MKLMSFEPKPGVVYKNNYPQIFKDISIGKLSEKETLKRLIKKDLWFVMYFILGMKNVNCKFAAETCYEVENGPESNTLDLFAREHLKSSIMKAQIIQRILNNPERTNLILSYVKPLAEKHLFAIKSVFENVKILHELFPDICWKKPETEAPIWAVKDGLVFKRVSNRSEPTLMAGGLTEGMPTGMHFEEIDYDDIMTQDMADSIEVMESVKLRFDASMSLGAEGGNHRVRGTPYHYDDPLAYIQGKKCIDDESKSEYLLRFKPATVDGTRNGKPVFLSQKRLDSLKNSKVYNCHFLLDPSPRGQKKFNKEYVTEVAYGEIPNGLKKYMIIDPAGPEGTGDPYAILIVGVKPSKTVSLYQRDNVDCDIYILDMKIEKMKLNDAIRTIVDMYCEHGRIQKLCVEELSQSTTNVHIARELKDRGYKGVTEENGRIQIYHPRKRKKNARIEDGISWPLENGKIYMSKCIDVAYRNVFRSELYAFPDSNDNHAIDILSYFVLDTIPDIQFRDERVYEPPEEVPIAAYC